MENRKESCPMRADVEKTEEFAKSCYKALHGNGQPGLIKEFEALKTSFKDFRIAVSGDIKSIDEKLDKVFKDNIVAEAVQNRKSKTILQATGIFSTIAAIAAILIDVL